MISILIIDDHPLVLDGITTMLKDIDFLTIAGTCKTGSDAIAFLRLQEADIILLDINLPDMTGLDLCTLIRKKNKHSKILTLTSTNEAGLIAQMLKYGADGYLLKNMEREELIRAINTVLDGKIFLSKEVNEKLLEQFQSVNLAVNSIPVLTRREKEILILLNEGLTGPQMAEKLFLSSFTIETHRKNLMQKLHAGSTQQLLKIARDNQLI